MSRPRDTVNDLIRRADTAMYHAKRTGTAVQIYHPDMPGAPDDPVVLHLP